MTDLLENRKSYATDRLCRLQEKINTIEELQGLDDLCIYATGSYGRLEASKNSDLDLFFLRNGKEGGNKVPSIKKTLIDAELIKICRDEKLPEFSGDGKYLEIHYFADMEATLGGPEDDARNFFTARLLLLLESRPVHNQSVYNDLVLQVINTYYRDYPDHDKKFNNRFLMNDILRFWKTLCLNYEQRRNRYFQMGGGITDAEKSKSQLKNLKLKFSRMLTCFSMVAVLSRNPSVAAEQCAEYVKTPPLWRLTQAVEGRQGGQELVQQIHEEYAWFLQQTGETEPDVLSWISDEQNREDAFERARNFGGSLYNTLRISISEDPSEQHKMLRYLVI